MRLILTRRWLILLPILLLALSLVGYVARAPLAGRDAQVASVVSPTGTASPTASASPTATATATTPATATATRTATATLTATPTLRPTRTPSPSATATTFPSATPAVTPTPTEEMALPVAAAAEATPVATTEAPNPARADTGLVLANYFAWYDAGGWGACNISAGDQPAEPYQSDDPAAIARQIHQALDVGIDGFTLQWFAPGERTDNNLATLLAQSQGTSFRSTVIFLRHIWHGSPSPLQEEVVAALRYLLDRYTGHPNWLTIEGRPVIFFVDLYRVPAVAGQTPQQAWAAIRAQVDPEHRQWWIGEGLDASYLQVFDGLYVYKITHAAYPDDYVKDSRWAAAVRQWEQNTGQRKLWWGTITPGWDDLRSGCVADVRTPSTPHKREREDGAFYQQTFDAALASEPDGLWINSWNEWVEGTYIEPSVQYGDRYLQLTRELIARYKGG